MGSHSSTEDKYTQFWSEFKLSPNPVANALFKHTQWLYLLFFVTYGYFLYGMLTYAYGLHELNFNDLRTFRPWFGSVFVSMAEAHVLIFSLLPISIGFVRWASSIQNTLDWLRKPILRIRVREGDFDEQYLAYLHKFQARLVAKWPSAIL